MNFDDETLLSAYLDDELDPADRVAIEWSIESSPPLAGRLRSLVLARDAVAGLGRPLAPVDLGPILASRVAALRPVRPRTTSRAGTLALAGGFVSLAAGLLAAMFFLHLATHDVARPTFLARFFGTKAQSSPVSLPSPVRDQPRLDVGPPLLPRLASAPAVVARPDEVVGPPAEARLNPSGAIVREQTARERIAGMLKRPDVHRILIVTDVIDAGERIQALIQTDSRKRPDFGRITVTEGIVIDPRHPGEADVFTLVLEPRECEPFLGKLARALPHAEPLVELRPDPSLLTRLAEVGQMAILPGLSTTTPPDLPLVMATNDYPTGLRATRDPGTGSFTLPEMDPLAAIDGFPTVQDRAGDQNRGGPARFPATSGPTTLVVWVTRPYTRR